MSGHAFKKVFVLCLSLLAGTSVFGQQKITVGTNADFPPFESFDASRKIVGVDIDLMNAIGKDQKLEVSFRNIGWSDLLPFLKSGRVDAVISGMTILDQRKSQVDFSRPYLSMPQVIVVKKGTKGISVWKDLQGMRLGVLKGSKTAAALKTSLGETKLHLTEIGDTDVLFDSVLNGGVDAVLVDRLLAQAWKANPEVSGKVDLAGPTDFTEDFAVAVAKGNQTLLEKMNKGIESLGLSGDLNRITASLLK